MALATRDETFLYRLADAAARVVLPHFRSPLLVENKETVANGRPFDPVTVADRAAEAAMRELIVATFPDDGILGEEEGERNPDAEHIWILDPIDGTRSFISGVPLWGTLIGLAVRGWPQLGLMAQPFTRERFSGDGRAARYQGPDGTRALKTRPCRQISTATLFATSPDMFSASESERFGKLSSRVRLTRFGADCYAYCMVAAGFVDVVMEAGLKPYDIAALIPIVEGAGGRITDWQGNPAGKGGQVLACGDPGLHDHIVALLGT